MASLTTPLMKSLWKTSVGSPEPPPQLGLWESFSVMISTAELKYQSLSLTAQLPGRYLKSCLVLSCLRWLPASSGKAVRTFLISLDLGPASVWLETELLDRELPWEQSRALEVRDYHKDTVIGGQAWVG